MGIYVAVFIADKQAMALDKEDLACGELTNKAFVLSSVVQKYLQANKFPAACEYG